MRPLVLSLLLVAACGPGPEPEPEPLPDPFADIDVDGLDLTSAEANASITLPQQEGDPAFRTVFLVDPAAAASLQCGAEVPFAATLTLRFEIASGEVPGPGSYAVGGDPAVEPSVTVNGIGCEPVGGVRATGGTVTLDVADDELVEGELEVILEDGEATGTFRAHHCQDESVFVCL